MVIICLSKHIYVLATPGHIIMLYSQKLYSVKGSGFDLKSLYSRPSINCFKHSFFPKLFQNGSNYRNT